MKELLKKVYYCEFCKKKGMRKHLIQSHEQICWGNPAARPACADCQHLTSEQFERERYHPTGDVTYTKGIPTPWCKLYNKQIHTPSAEYKGVTERYADDFQDSEVMPMECVGQQPYRQLEADTLLP